MNRVVMTERALRDLGSIRRVSVERFGQRVTSEYLARFDRSIESIAASPGLLVARPEVSGRLLFYRVDKHWMVCDRAERVIFILTIMHAAMDIQERLATLEPTLIREAELLHRSIFGRGPSS